MIFIIKGFRTIVFIFIVISTFHLYDYFYNVSADITRSFIESTVGVSC